MSILVYSGISALMVLMSILSFRFMVKKELKRENIMEITEEILVNSLDMVLTENEMQKRVFSLGVLLGNGIKAGVGLNTRGGKRGLDTLVMDGLSMLFQGAMNKQETPTTSEPSSLAKAFK